MIQLRLRVSYTYKLLDILSIRWALFHTSDLSYSHGLYWDRFNTLHRASYDAVFGIFDENSDENTPVFSDIDSEDLGVHKEMGEGHSQHNWPNLTKEISHMCRQ